MSSIKKVLLGMLVVTAMVVANASIAAAVEFHSETEHTIITGTQIGITKFTTTAGEITCEKVEGASTATSKTQASVRGTSTLSSCHINIFGSKIAATVNQNGCEGIAYANGEAEMVCPEGKSATVVAAGCTITVGPQKNKGATYSNVENHIKVSGTTTGIKYSHSGFSCGTGSGTNGTMKGEGTVKGTNTEGKAVKIWVE
jgi:hypothetical protein